MGHRLKRLVIIGADGLVSLAALRWLADQDVAFTMLERDGKVLAVTGPVRPSDAKLRRAQALAHSSGAALLIARELITQKLIGQERVARHKLLDATTADAIARFRAELPTADSITTVRLIESQAGVLNMSMIESVYCYLHRTILWLGNSKLQFRSRSSYVGQKSANHIPFDLPPFEHGLQFVSEIESVLQFSH
ncbi:MAG: CRISPR-associated endonuclease Cas1 [Candidatus Sulfotelmatobacter sp.]